MIIRRIRIGTGTQFIYVCVCKLEEQQASSSVFCGLLCLMSNSILIWMTLMLMYVLNDNLMLNCFFFNCRNCRTWNKVTLMNPSNLLKWKRTPTKMLMQPFCPVSTNRKHHLVLDMTKVRYLYSNAIEGHCNL
jgi:hypothetical protein